MMYVIAKIFKNHPQYKRSYKYLKIDSQKVPKEEHFLNIDKSTLRKIHFLRDGVKPPEKYKRKREIKY